MSQKGHRKRPLTATFGLLLPMPTADKRKPFKAKPSHHSRGLAGCPRPGVSYTGDQKKPKTAYIQKLQDVLNRVGLSAFFLSLCFLFIFIYDFLMSLSISF